MIDLIEKLRFILKNMETNFNQISSEINLAEDLKEDIQNKDENKKFWQYPINL